MSEKEPVKIIQLDITDFKRIKAFNITPEQVGTTVIGGKNAQGKTSVLDALEYLLGGGKHKPTSAQREGAEKPPVIAGKLSNGITVKRSGKNSALTVTDETGMKGGQTLLDELFSQLSLNITPFLESSAKKKAETLLKTIGVGDELDKIDAEEKRLSDERVIVGRESKNKQGLAESLPSFDDAPKEPVVIGELIQQQKEIVDQIYANQSVRMNRLSLASLIESYDSDIAEQERVIAQLKNDRQATKDNLDATPAPPDDQSTDEIESQIANAESLNEKYRANEAKAAARKESLAVCASYEKLTDKIESARDSRTALLDGADMPLDGLSVDAGELTYKSQKWDCMSQAEQLRVACAIAMKLKPDCGLLVLDGAEKFDVDTMKDFDKWAKVNNLQIITTRVSTGDECTIVIEDGCIA